MLRKGSQVLGRIAAVRRVGTKRGQCRLDTDRESKPARSDGGRRQSEAIGSNRKQSEAIGGIRRQSEAISLTWMAPSPISSATADDMWMSEGKCPSARSVI